MLSFEQSNYYDQIVQRYINTVAGQFFGHSHKVSSFTRSLESLLNFSLS
jgi:hypothetical protein